MTILNSVEKRKQKQMGHSKKINCISGKTSTLNNWKKLYVFLEKGQRFLNQVDKNQLLIGKNSTFRIIQFVSFLNYFLS